MAMHCLLCSRAVTGDDHYRDLDCSFPKCPGECYHEDCITRYLRKKGHGGGEQKTGYPCPAVLNNGGNCPGTIIKTHIRAPTNEKKKQQSRQAAVVVNQLANAARGVASTAPKPAVLRGVNIASAAKINVLRAVPGAIKPSIVAQRVKAGDGARVRDTEAKANNDGDHSEGESPRPSMGTLADYLAQPKGQKQQEQQEQQLEQKKQHAWSTPSFTSTTTTYSTDSYPSITSAKKQPLTSTAQAVAKNSAMAPERVVRQRVVPGWTSNGSGGGLDNNSGSTAASSYKKGLGSAAAASTLEQQRALVAALRAEVRGGAAAGKAAAAARVGPAAAAAAAIAKADTTPKKALQPQSTPGDWGSAEPHPGDPNAGNNAAAAVPAAAAAAAAPQDHDESYDDDDGGDDVCSPDAGAGATKIGATNPTVAAAGGGSQSSDAAKKQQQQQLFASPSSSPCLSPTASQPSTPAIATPPTAPHSGADSANATPACDAPYAGDASGGLLGDSAAAAAAEDADPVVEAAPVFQLADGAVVVQDEYGSYLPVEQVYGPAPELMGFQDEAGGVSYYVVVRQSVAQAAAAAAEAAEAVADAEVAAATAKALAAQGQQQHQHLTAYATLEGAKSAAYGATATLAASGGYQRAQAQNVAGHDEGQSAVGNGGGYEEDDDDDLGDLLALCLGGASA